MTVNITALWDALGWAVLHSFWQGALIGLAVWLLRSLATPRRAGLRYLAGMAGLVGTFVAFLATFIHGLIHQSGGVFQVMDTAALPETRDGVGLTLQILPTMVPTAAAETSASPTLADTASLSALMPSLVTPLIPWLGIVWAVGFACLSLQAYRAWTRTRRLATTGLSDPGADWASRLATLAARSGAPERVRLFISEHVAGPLTLGTLKPVILVPAGFLTSLPPAQLEAILLHELAHIRRHDFLFGLVQTAIRTALYFNPAVIILSRQVDEDREQAC
ncbi:MAG: M56 family metallopeptidase, partial [Litorimonas sp.]